MSLLSWLQKSAAANGSRESLASSSRQSLRQGDMIASETASSTEQNGSEHTLTPESPNQPVLTFPQRMFGNQQRAFCSSWYSKYPWLHYQVGTDSVFCYYCMIADKRGLPMTKNKDDAFCKVGFTNWKKALEKFEKHQNTASHHEAVDLVVKIPSTTKNVGEMLSTSYASQKEENRKMLSVILSSIRYLGRQGLALRGRYKTNDDLTMRGEIDSNFMQLLRLRAEDSPGILKWIDLKTNLLAQTCRMKYLALWPYIY